MATSPSTALVRRKAIFGILGIKRPCASLRSDPLTSAMQVQCRIVRVKPVKLSSLDIVCEPAVRTDISRST